MLFIIQVVVFYETGDAYLTSTDDLVHQDMCTHNAEYALIHFHMFIG